MHKLITCEKFINLPRGRLLKFERTGESEVSEHSTRVHELFKIRVKSEAHRNGSEGDSEACCRIK